MTEAYRRAVSKKSYEELEEDNNSLRHDLSSANKTIHQMSILLQESVEAVLRVARERNAEGQVTEE